MVDSDTTADATETGRLLDQELTEVRAAIALVREGQAGRVRLDGLRFAEQLIRRLDPEAKIAGVVLEPDVFPEDSGCDVVVRRRDPGEPW